MSIRDAEPKDRDDIERLNQEIFNYEVENCDPTEDINFPQTDVGQNFFNDIVNKTNGHFGYVFDDNNIIKGYVSLRVVTEEEYNHRQGISLLQLQTLGIDENFRNQKIGSALVSHAKAVAKELGFSHLKVASLAKNTHARHLYKKCGFEELEIHHEIEL